MRVLITGVAGFVGTHLSAYLSKTQKAEVFGLRRPSSKKAVAEGVHALSCDIRDLKALRKNLKKIKPQRIFHLAASASVAQSWRDPAETFENNVTGTRLLLEAIRIECPLARIHVASSAEVYGACRRSGERLKETVPFRPFNPYAASKIAQEALAQQYGLSHGLHIVRTRAFNHIGPGQSDIFVASDFAKQTALIERGRQKPLIQVGNLSAIRDFSDVRDIVRAYWLCLEGAAPGDVYNVCSGRARSVEEILEYYLALSPVKIAVQKNMERFRIVDAPALVGDPMKLKKKTGWKPMFTFKGTLQDIMKDWRKRCTF